MQRGANGVLKNALRACWVEGVSEGLMVANDPNNDTIRNVQWRHGSNHRMCHLPIDPWTPPSLSWLLKLVPGHSRDHATTENSADMWDGDNDKERKKERGKKKIINRWHDWIVDSKTFGLIMSRNLVYQFDSISRLGQSKVNTEILQFSRDKIKKLPDCKT